MFDNLKDTYDTYQKMDPTQRGPFATIMVFKYIAYMVYDIVCGVVVLSLGKRIIQATYAAFKEAKRV